MEVPYAQKIFGLIPWYSFLIILGIIISIWLMNREALRKGLSADTGIDIALWSVPFGIIGARLYFVIFRWQDYVENPISIFAIWEGGLAIYGAVIGGALGIYFYSKRKKISFLMLLDIVAPGLILSQSIGRWGNYFNMEAFGPMITEPSLQFFPICVLIRGTEWHMATFFYESCWNLVCFLVLLWLRGKCDQKGQIFFWYLILYGSGRFVIEQLREDSLYFLGLRVSQWLSLLMCIAASALLLIDKTDKKRQWIAMLAVFFLICRYFFMNQPLLYGGFSLISCIIVFFLTKRSLKALCFCVLAVDLFGLVCSQKNLCGSENVSSLVMALLCSLTFCFQQILLFLSKRKSEEKMSCQ